MNLLRTLLAGKSADADQTRVLLQRILATMRESVIVVGSDTRILASNLAAYDSFGRKNGPLEGKRLSEVIRDLGVHEAFRKALEDAEFSDVEFVIVGAENRKFEVRIAPVDVGDKSGAIGIFYDKTNIERLETVRQEFFSNISHELRTPLTSIIAFVETLEDGALNDAENNLRFLGVIRRNAERMHALIDDILELSTIESGRVAIEPRSVELSRAVTETFVNISNKASEFDVRLVNDVPEGATVSADPIRLEQMLTNLIDNAVKFNVRGGSVRVGLLAAADSDLITIADTGEGISSEHLQRIFERFYRTDRARSREIGGTGLGLAIVKHLARLHGGEITVTSSPGRGSVFSIELPRR
jgi:two-component system phosphate regulon sensor histidine kinase PhoR